MMMVAGLLAGCSEGDMPEVYSDDAGEIKFNTNLMGAAGDDHVHRPWQDGDPTKIFVSWFDKDGTAKGQDIEVSHSETGWSYTAPDDNSHKWSKYVGITSLDFIGVLANSKDGITIGNDRITIESLPTVALEEKNIFVCHTPTYVAMPTAIYNVQPVGMVFDRIYSRFSISFQLSEAMSKLRHIHITDVQINGVNTVTNYTQSYTKAGTEWTKEKATYTASTAASTTLSLKGTATSYFLPLGYGMNQTDYVKFGTASAGFTYKEKEANAPAYNTCPEVANTPSEYFYVLPGTAAPTITVSYVVYDEWGYETRQATQQIELKETVFKKDFTSILAADTYDLKIKIVPDYLYVLSDADQVAGILVVK